MTNNKNIIPFGGSHNYYELNAFFAPNVFKKFTDGSENPTFIRNSESGTLTISKEDLISFLEKAGARLAIQSNDNSYGLFIKESYIHFSISKNNHITLYWELLNPELLDLINLIKKDFLTKELKKLVFSIVSNPNGGFKTVQLGNGHSELFKDNYSEEVMIDVNFVISSFKQTPPIGRIAIFDGPPGTGKTFLIRSLFGELDQLFLILPSNLISQLDNPQFLPTLLSVKDNYEKPIVLVIEDGDACLVPRKTDNISAIAALLNLSDGILGSMLDIKVIISTNAGEKEIDSAIMRPGRLCRRINVGALPYERANKVYKRLMKDDAANLEKAKEYTLAEIYEKFNNKDVVFPESKSMKRSIGFNIEKDENLLDKTLNLASNDIL